jgi:hypothetical protein
LDDAVPESFPAAEGADIQMPTENDIRDQLALRLSLIEPGLELLATNWYLRNAAGTRGFIDILARDAAGVYVVLELKRSNSTAREAIHEVIKYTELLKSDMGLDESKIRAIIVSTVWTELAVPFSHFTREWRHSLRGYEMRLDAAGLTPIAMTEFQPVAETPRRGITPIHIGIADRLGGIMDAGSAWNVAVTDLAEVGADDLLGFELTRPGSNILYIVMGKITKGDPRTEPLKAYEEDAPDDPSDPRGECALEERAQIHFCYNHGELWFENAYPDKLTSYLQSGWQVARIRRAGIFAKQADLVSDPELLEQVVREAGHSQVNFRGVARPNNALSWQHFRQRLSLCLTGSGDWQRMLFLWFDDRAYDAPDSTITVNLYNPCDFLGAIIMGWPDNIDEYLPQLTATQESDNADSRSIEGSLVWDGSDDGDVMATIASSYAEPFDWSFATLTGEKHLLDLKLLAGLGLSYSIAESAEDGGQISRLTVENGKLLRSPAQSISADAPGWRGARPVADFLSTHREQISQIQRMYSQHIRRAH